jgi:hypothetical protein
MKTKTSGKVEEWKDGKDSINKSFISHWKKKNRVNPAIKAKVKRL